MANGTTDAVGASEAVGTPMRLRAAGWTLLAVSVVLNVASLAVPALVHHPLTRDRGEIRMYLDVFGEGNLPTWWSTGLLVTGALLHAVTAVLARARARAESWRGGAVRHCSRPSRSTTTRSCTSASTGSGAGS